MLLEWIYRRTGILALKASLVSAGFTREERNTTVFLNDMPVTLRLRDEVFPLLAEDLMKTGVLGRAFHVPAIDDHPDVSDVSFYVEGADILIRMTRPGETYGLTLFWRGEPGLFLYSDLSLEDWEGRPVDHLKSCAPRMERFCDVFLQQRSGRAGKALPFEVDYLNGMGDP